MPDTQYQWFHQEPAIDRTMSLYDITSTYIHIILIINSMIMKPLLSADMMLLQYIQFGVSKGASLHCAYGGVPLYILTWYNIIYVVIADMF